MDTRASFNRTPEQHRAAVAAIPDRPFRQVLSWPTGERLARSYIDAARTLVWWRDLMEPAHHLDFVDVDDETMHPPIESTDRPTLDEVLMISGHRYAITTQRHARGVWGEPVAHVVTDREQIPDGHGQYWFGKLCFRSGQLVSWGQWPNERPREPFEDKKPRGGRRPGSCATMRVAGTDRRMPVTSYGDRAEAEAWRLIEARIARKTAGPFHAEVLDCAISSMTAREIGEQFGSRGKYAERRGVRLVDDAIAHMQAAAANDNIPHESSAVAA